MGEVEEAMAQLCAVAERGNEVIAEFQEMLANLAGDPDA